MFYPETELQRRRRKVDKEILAEHGVTHPRAMFLLYSCPRPAGDDWGYLLDEVPVPGYSNRRWWPFDTQQVRLAPDTAFYAWYCEYISLRASNQAHLAVARMTVHIPKLTGGGSFGVTTEVQINVRDRTVTVLDDDVTGDLKEQADWKARSVLALLLRERDRRRRGASRPRTAHELATNADQAPHSTH